MEGILRNSWVDFIYNLSLNEKIYCQLYKYI
jgi:hypothetical protein